MPLFEYFCESCETQHEVLVRGQERPACPSCGSTKLVKQASAFAPLTAAASRPKAPVGCGAESCCHYQGGSCALN